MTFQKAITLPLIALSLAFSTGCSAKPSPEGHVKVKEAVQTNAVQANSVKTDHVHGKTSKTQRYMKPGAAISYEHNLPGDIAPGETAVFQLVLNESYNTGTMTVNIEGDGDVQVFPTSSYATFDMSTGRQHIMDVSVTVGSNGRHYLNVRAEADSNGQSMPRIFSIAVQSGPRIKMAPHSKMTKTSSGENIIMMEADEVIR